MNFKVPFIIIFIIVNIIFLPCVGENFIIVVKDIPDNSGYFVRGLCHNNDDGTFIVYIDENVVNSPDYQVVLLHEIGHVGHWDEWSEEDCDNFANSFGIGKLHDGTY